MAIRCVDRNLVARLWRETVQPRGGHVSRHRLLTRLVGEEGLPGDPVAAHVARRRRPGGHKAGVGDVTGDQVLRGAKLCTEGVEGRG